MEKLIFKNESYSITLSVDDSYIYEIADFVVRENRMQHAPDENTRTLYYDINKVYKEESTYRNKLLYIVRDLSGKLIGCIRVFKWNKSDILPIKSIFGVDPSESLYTQPDTIYWHVGRFAISQNMGKKSVELFKRLMALAISPIVNDEGNSCMIAETDSKLLRVMNILGMKTRQLAESKIYLNSETIPIISLKSDLSYYYNRYSYLTI